MIPSLPAVLSAVMMVSNLSPVQQAVLDRIASGESHGYDTIFGGHRFQSFSDHPRIKIPLPNGQYTTAAGRYQMTAPTWADERRRLGLKDFSPESQDQAAWDLASRTYAQRTGRDLASDTAQGRTDWAQLGNQWTSLKGQGPDAQLSAVAMPSPGNALSVTAPGQVIKPLPELRDNPGSELPPAQALGALRAAAPGVSLLPVDYHPWRQGPSLLPVDHNPFPAEESSHAD